MSSLMDRIADFRNFWTTHFPEQTTISREAALASIKEVADGQRSRRPDAEMAAYQDRVAAVYGAYETAAFQEATITHLMTKLSLGAERDVVSLGCGPASYELWLLHQRLARHATLVDHSPAMLARARTIAETIGVSDRVATLCRDASSTSLRAASGDIVLCINAMHWSANWPAWVQEAWRLSRKNGHVFISTSLGLPRSDITPETFGQEMRRHFKRVEGGMVLPPTNIGGGMAALSSRFYATGRRA